VSSARRFTYFGGIGAQAALRLSDCRLEIIADPLKGHSIIETGAKREAEHRCVRDGHDEQGATRRIGPHQLTYAFERAFVSLRRPEHQDLMLIATASSGWNLIEVVVELDVPLRVQRPKEERKHHRVLFDNGDCRLESVVGSHGLYYLCVLLR
jgi:hypothetical protein